ncbi:MAG: GNAT family N-acetyltransferase, partial [Myxococcales bacterium]|nr:GNAT family N-acetyltransferase [Myxococcales bacterium]
MRIESIDAHPQHVPTVARWIWEQWRHHSGLTLEQTRVRLLEQPDCPTPLLALDVDQPIGVLGFGRFDYQAKPPPVLFIDVLYVRRDRRGLGIGSALLSRGLASARTAADRRLHVYTDIPRFYEQRGFTLLDQLPG